MAIDFGDKRLGVAVSDPSCRVAQPLVVVDRADLKQDVARLAAVIEEFEVARIVVGNPRTMAGEEGAQAAHVRRFASALRRALDLPIELYDERLSSKEARAGLALAGLRGKQAKGKVDKVAAALFLQSYLDKEAGRERP